MPLLINNEESEQLMDMKACMDALETAFKEEGLGSAANRTKSNIHIPTDDPDLWYRYCSMEGGVRGMGVAAIRIKTDMVSSPILYGKRRTLWHCVRPGKYGGLILLFSARNGELLAILNDGYIQHMRVGATAGLAARQMAREDATTVGILGTGGLATTHAQAYAEARQLKLIKVYSPNPEHRQQFAHGMSQRLGVEVQPLDNPREVVRGSDVVAACTDAAEPVLFGEWLEPGMHLTSVTMMELDDAFYRRIDRCVTYRSEICQNHFTTPEDWRPPGLGGSTTEQMRKLAEIGRDRSHTLPQVLLGKVAGRSDPQEINYFVSEGTGVQFAAAAYKVYEQAKVKGLGRELPLEWFLEDIRN